MLYLASDDIAMVTSHTLSIDGGVSGRATAGLWDGRG